jgi:glycosyltransferase involved in cell wall biosynthesis
LLWKVEPLLYKVANVKVVVMPYGGDVQELSRSKNLMYKSAISKDYPDFKLKRKRIEKRIDLWTEHASHIISGCDWVEYMYHWDTLVLAHFTIDVNEWKPRNEIVASPSGPGPLRIFHAPNHEHIKGTRHFQTAVDELKREGVKIELVIAEKLPHEKIKEMIARSDIVADQLIIGWYGMFAVEAMAMGKPVLCYIRPDFEELFINEGLIRPGELPIIKCSPLNLAETLRGIVGDQEGLNEIGQKSRQFVITHHSTTSLGKVFDRINQSIGIRPSGEKIV